MLREVTLGKTGRAASAGLHHAAFVYRTPDEFLTAIQLFAQGWH